MADNFPVALADKETCFICFANEYKMMQRKHGTEHLTIQKTTTITKLKSTGEVWFKMKQ